MNLTHDDVIEILRLIDQSSYEELHLEVGEVKIVIKKKGSGIAAAPVSGAVAAPEPIEAGAAARAPATARNGHVLTAPVVGVFYRAPAPGEPPFVDVGSRVTEDATVGIIEVMKLMHAVRAGCRGRVAEILAENARPVEYGQPLIVIEPGP